MNIQATHHFSGEVIELPVDTPEQIQQAWLVASEYEKTAKRLKDQLKEIVVDLVDESGTKEVNGYMFRVSSIQRFNYDKSLLRNTLDEDTYDLFMKPNKTVIDRYLKENIETLGDTSTILRKNMIAEGNPYQVIKMEKLS